MPPKHDGDGANKMKKYNKIIDLRSDTLTKLDGGDLNGLDYSKVGDDCYGEDFHTSLAWNRVDRDGVPLPGLVNFIQSMPEGQLWRDKVAGDLPGDGEHVDPAALGEVVKANIGRRGFTYTHKKSPQAIKWIRHANEWGYTINLSADDAGEADALADLQAGPVVCIVPMDTPSKATTPAGRSIVVCPAQLKDDVTCYTCQLCQRRDRDRGDQRCRGR